MKTLRCQSLRWCFLKLGKTGANKSKLQCQISWNPTWFSFAVEYGHLTKHVMCLARSFNARAQRAWWPLQRIKIPLSHDKYSPSKKTSRDASLRCGFMISNGIWVCEMLLSWEFVAVSHVAPWCYGLLGGSSSTTGSTGKASVRGDRSTVLSPCCHQDFGHLHFQCFWWDLSKVFTRAEQLLFVTSRLPVIGEWAAGSLCTRKPRMRGTVRVPGCWKIE